MNKLLNVLIICAMAFTLSSSKEGYVFIGWSTTPNGDAECEDGSTFSKKKQIM